MKYAVIKLDSRNHEIKYRTVYIKTIFGDIPVPEKKIILNDNIAKVPLYCFGANGFNPCQVITGYEGICEQ